MTCSKAARVRTISCPTRLRSRLAAWRSIQVKDSNDNPTSDGNIDANGNPVVADYDPGYGGTWNFNDSTPASGWARTR